MRRAGLLLLLAAVCLASLTLGPGPREVSAAVILPRIVFLSNDVEGHTKLINHYYAKGITSDKSFDAIGKELDVALVSAGSGPVGSKVVEAIRGLLGDIMTTTLGLAIPLDALKSNAGLAALARSVINSQKYVYVFGVDMGLADVESALNLSLDRKPVIPATDKDPRQAPSYDSKFTVVGVKASTAGLELRTSSTHGPTFVQSQFALRDVADWARDDIRTGINSAENGIGSEWVKVYTWPLDRQNWTTPEGLLVGRLNTALRLFKSTADQDAQFDMFTLRPNYELIPGSNFQTGNPYHLGRFLAQPKLTYAQDQLEGWAPGSKTGQSFTVGLPASASWNFTIGEDSVRLKTEPHLGENYVNYWFLLPWWSEYQSEPWHMEPGTQWASTGTLAEIGVWHDIAFMGYSLPEYRTTYGRILTYDY